ncbi:uncharacterized protein [Equus asinus]|uniref:uncharacterized protein isoform X3 n=1 Tax=Equus asinus TaxID=9793 RepID=UPI0038F77151
MLRLKSEASLEAEFPQRRTLSAAVVAIGSCSPESWSPSRLCSLVPSELHMYQCHYLSLPSGIQLLVWEIITNPTESCDVTLCSPCSVGPELLKGDVAHGHLSSHDGRTRREKMPEDTPMTQP